MANVSYDAVIVGAGPNGLTAAVTLATRGLSVIVLEAQETIGGGARTVELTGPGFWSDVCSAIHPIGVVSPAFQEVGIARELEWVHPPLALAHPFDDGTAAVLATSLEETGASLGADGDAWRRLMAPFLEDAPAFFAETLKPIRLPQHPVLMLRFALEGLWSCERLARRRFTEPRARALLAGCAAHSFLPLSAAGSASFGIVLALAAHAIHWPVVRGGSRRIVEALERRLSALGGAIRTGFEVRSMRDLPAARAVLFAVTPRQLARIAGDALPRAYRRRLERFRYGPGAFKLDWALDGPIPWKAAACRRAGTVHVGATLEEIARSERDANEGRLAEKPFVIVTQQSLFDATRAPAGRHTGWAYCHVPHGSSADRTAAIEGQIERMAPGFRDRILARHVLDPRAFEAHDANFIGGDIAGGANDLAQFLFRPFPRLDPYTTPNPRIYLCSSSTPPGGGVHGMCGFNAARSALRRSFGKESAGRPREAAAP